MRQRCSFHDGAMATVAEMVVEVFCQIGSVRFGSVDVTGSSAPEEVDAEQVHTGRIGHDATGVADAAFAVEYGNVPPAVIGSIPGRPNDGTDAAVAQVGIEDRRLGQAGRLEAFRRSHSIETCGLNPLVKT